jgi:hypothetical protein
MLVPEEQVMHAKMSTDAGSDKRQNKNNKNAATLQ